MSKEQDLFYEKQHQYNIKQKEMFHEWLQDALKQKEDSLFKEIVKFIGREWSVLRTVEKEKIDEFCENLWDNQDDIKKGEYKWNDSKYHAYSYESKICFLIKPEKYKLIYDGNVRKALNNATKDNWQKEADAKVKCCYGNKKISEKDAYEIDWNLWLEGYKKQ